MPGYSYFISSSNWKCKTWIEAEGRRFHKFKTIALFFTPSLDLAWLLKVWVSAAAAWEREQGLYWTQAAVGTMDATTPTPAPGPVPAGIHLGTWGCLSSGLNAPFPTTRSWVPSLLTRLSLPTAPTFSAATTRILNTYTLNLLIWTKIRRKSTLVNSCGCILLFLNYLTLRNCSAARTDLGEYNIKSLERTILALCTNSTFGRGQSRLLLSLCLIVCLFVSCSCSRTKASASILPQSKNFPTCPLHCGCQPTNQRHAASRQRGFDANLQTSNNHYWWFACLPGTV